MRIPTIKSSFHYQSRLPVRDADQSSIEGPLSNHTSLHLKVKNIEKLLPQNEKIIQPLARQDFLIDKLDEKVKTVPQTIPSSQKIVRYQPTHKPENNQLLNKANLEKIIRVGGILTREKPNILICKDKAYLARLNKHGNIKVYEFGRKLGSGTYGKVFAAVDLHKKRERALKIAQGNSDAWKDLKNEHDMLCRIHANGKVLGIQKKPKTLFDISLRGTKIMGYLGAKYDHDYLIDINQKFMSIDHRLREFYQLAFGLSHLEGQGIIHGDIKPQNILVKQGPRMNLVDLADFGTALDANRASVEEMATNPYSSNYIAQEDLDLRKVLLNNDNKKEMVHLCQKGDVFALGTVFFQALTGYYPFNQKTEKKHPVLSSYSPELLNQAAVPYPIQKLIKKMLDPNYKKRPSAQKVLQVLEALAKNENQDYRKLHIGV